jgi:hypothetical protein
MGSSVYKSNCLTPIVRTDNRCVVILPDKNRNKQADNKCVVILPEQATNKVVENTLKNVRTNKHRKKICANCGSRFVHAQAMRNKRYLYKQDKDVLYFCCLKCSTQYKKIYG